MRVYFEECLRMFVTAQKTGMQMTSEGVLQPYGATVISCLRYA